MNKIDLIFKLHEIGAIQFGEFTLKSGLTSSIYINLRKIISYPQLMRDIAHFMWEKISAHHFDLLCGVPYTALPIATCLSIDKNIPMVMRRKEKKEYGTKQMIEGVFQSDQICLIIEDLITTGSSIIETANELIHVGLKINDVIAFIDREQGGKINLEKQFRTHTVLSLTEIFNVLLTSNRISSLERNHIEKLLSEKISA